MVKLVISASMADEPSLKGAIDSFSRAGMLLWLAPTGMAADAAVPAINNLASAPEDAVFVVAPTEECVVPNGQNSHLMRIVERGSVQSSSELVTAEIDNFSQLTPLLELDSYTGLSRLLSHREWQAKDYRNAIMERYSAALKQLADGRKAAVFGAQRLGQLVKESLQVEGVEVVAFVDNNTSKHGTQVSGIPVCALSELNDKNIPVVIATTRFSNSIAKQLEKESFSNVLPYSVMSLLNPEHYPEEIPYVGIQQDFAENVAEYVGLFLCLEDERSRRVLDGLINYRLDYDTRKADDVADEYARQYFDEKLIQFSAEDVLVDLGGYDGDTAEKFIQFGGGVGYKKIYLFEPDGNLLEAAQRRLHDQTNIEYVPAGAYSKDGELRFSASGRTNGSISETGELVIPVRKIDSVVTEQPTLIKMDIEGSETEALLGAEKLLRTVRPRLAIAAYHFATDLWQLVKVIRTINPTYKFYLRHYSESGLESVIYAL